MKRKIKYGGSRKAVLFFVAVAICVCAAVGTTIAYLISVDGPTENRFVPAKPGVEVEEEITGGVKKNVCLKNTGETEEWIRAIVLISWQDKDGNPYGMAPIQGSDYSITWGGGSSWIKGDDGFYYYTDKVAVGASTQPLIVECKLLETANLPQDYSFTVEILGAGVQSYPDSAFNAWAPNSGITIQNGKLVKG